MTHPFHLLMIFITCLSVLHAGEWRAVDATRHEAAIAGWSLVVDAAQGRLVSAVPPGGTNVLLAGGHRVWLGPQTDWPAFWPPPADWENGPAIATRSRDAKVLTLALPHTDTRFPALTRRYQIEEGRLFMSVSWQPTEGHPGYQAVQILQTSRETVGTLIPTPGPGLTLGYGLLALAKRPGIDLGASAPLDIITPAPAGAWRLAFSGREEKIGVPPQPLEARFAGGHGLRLCPAVHNADVAKAPSPDRGLFTQIYFGDSAWAMVELEQLSPRLISENPASPIESTVCVEFLPPVEIPETRRNELQHQTQPTP